MFVITSHITENIFSNVETNQAIQACEQINSTSKQILNNPMFWLKKWIQRGRLSEKYQAGWIQAIQLTKNTELKAGMSPCESHL